MINWWFGLVVGIPGIPENERDCYLGVSLESPTTNWNHQLTISSIRIMAKQSIQVTSELLPRQNLLQNFLGEGVGGLVC